MKTKHDINMTEKGNVFPVNSLICKKTIIIIIIYPWGKLNVYNDLPNKQRIFHSITVFYCLLLRLLQSQRVFQLIKSNYTRNKNQIQLYMYIYIFKSLNINVYINLYRFKLF